MFWKGKEKGENLRCGRNQRATAHFESSIVTKEVCRERIPWALCSDRAYLPGALPGIGAHDQTWAHATRPHAAGTCVGDRDSQSRVVTKLLCRDKVWGWDWVAWVTTGLLCRNRVLLVLCRDRGRCRIGCGQGREALCHDIEIVSRRTRTSVCGK